MSEEKKYESVETQKRIWPKVVSDPATEKLYSYGWGDPFSAEARNKQGTLLGNYRMILRDFLLPYIDDKIVVDLGCFDGKWTQHMLCADLIICVDLDPTAYDIFRMRFPHLNGVFYQTEGDELHGIPDNTVDYIFSMDSLVRSEIAIIEKYIAEFKRVLKPDGKLCVHLPAQDQELSWKLGFTQIGSEQIEKICAENALTGIRIEKDIINHGILLLKGF